jgi:AraC family transcriptional regulator
MDASPTQTLSPRTLPSAHYIPCAIVPLSDCLPFDDILAFDVGPSTSLDPFPIPALDRVTLAISTQGDYPVEASLDGEFRRGHVIGGGPGSLSLIPAGMPAQVRICTGVAFNTNLFLSPALLVRVSLEALDRDPARLAPRPALFFEDHLLFELGLGVARILRGDGPDSTLCLETLSHTLAVHVLTQYLWLPARIPPVHGLLSRPALQQVIDFIDEQPAADLRLTRLAAIANLSPYHFSRLFQRTMGQPLHRYVLHRRLKRSCRLLLETDLSLAQIAADAGFADESHFLRRFKDAYGFTPGALRKERKILR